MFRVSPPRSRFPPLLGWHELMVVRAGSISTVSFSNMIPPRIVPWVKKRAPPHGCAQRRDSKTTPAFVADLERIDTSSVRPYLLHGNRKWHVDRRMNHGNRKRQPRATGDRTRRRAVSHYVVPRSSPLRTERPHRITFR